MRDDHMKRIQLQRKKDWRKPQDAVVVARPSIWGNPFRISGRPAGGGTVYGPPWLDVRGTWGRQFKTEAYAAYVCCSSYTSAVLNGINLFSSLMSIRQWEEPERFAEWIAPLKGKDLACWCPLNQPCHADILLQLVT